MNICPSQGYPGTRQEEGLDKLVGTVLLNNQQRRKPQTVIPVGVSGSGKTWSCQVVLRRLVKKCGYAQDTYLYSAQDVIKPFIVTAVPGSKDSSRMVRTIQSQDLLISKYCRVLSQSARLGMGVWRV